MTEDDIPKLTKPASSENQIDAIRRSIKATPLIQRLTMHALAPEDLMTSSQVQAAKVLLNKLVPDLKAVEFSGLPNDGLPQRIQINVINHDANTPDAIEEKDITPTIKGFDIVDAETAPVKDDDADTAN